MRLWIKFTLGAFMMLCATHSVWAANYTLPNGPLPSACSFNGSQVVCGGNLNLGNNDNIFVTQATELVISGDFSFGNNLEVNVGGNPNDLNIVVAGNMNPSNGAIINANLSVAGSINAGNNGALQGEIVVSGNLNLGNNSSVDGNITVTGTFQTGQNVNIIGDIDATNVNLGQNNLIEGDIDAVNVNINGSNTVVDGNVNATGTVNNNGTITGYVNADTINDNSGGIQGDACDFNGNEGPCGSGNNFLYYQLVHSGTALTCEPYSVNVRACADVGCTTTTAINGSVQIAEAAAGFTAATATFVNQSSVNVNLNIPSAGNYNLITANASGDLPAQTSQCSGPNGCQITGVDTALRFSGEQTQLAGVPFNLTLEALRTDTNTRECEAALDGAQTVDFGLQCEDPASCLTDISVAGTEVSTNTTPVTVNFNQGEALLAVNYFDAGRIRLSAATEVATGATLSDISAAFVVKPFGVNIQVTGNQAASYAPGDTLPAVLAAAGEPLTVSLTPIAANNQPTPNFGREQTPAVLQLVSAELVAPIASGANSPIPTNSNSFIYNGVNSFISTTVGYPEVGIARFVADLVGGDYLGAGGLTNATSVPVGRFIPAYFTAVGNVPVLADAQDDFTYYGQTTGFAEPPSFELQAFSADGQLLSNYRGEFARLPFNDGAGTALAWQANSLIPSGVTISNNAPNLAIDNSFGAPLQITQTGLQLTFVKPTEPTLPTQASYELSLAPAALVDLDNVTLQQPLAVTNNVAVELADNNGSELLWGVVAVDDQFGVSAEPLPVQITLATYQQLGGVNQLRVNLRDNSTVVTPAWLTEWDAIDDEYQALTCAGDILVAAGSQTVSAGKLQNWLVSGSSIDCIALWEIDLSGAGVDYLQAPLSGPRNNPAANLYFGRYRGNDRVIYRRESGW